MVPLIKSGRSPFHREKHDHNVELYIVETLQSAWKKSPKLFVEALQNVPSLTILLKDFAPLTTVNRPFAKGWPDHFAEKKLFAECSHEYNY